jgi:hypothetical protein
MSRAVQKISQSVGVVVGAVLIILVTFIVLGGIAWLAKVVWTGLFG